MEKVILKKEHADAIEFALNTERLAYYKNPDELLKSHIRSKCFLDEMFPLRSIDHITLAKALYVGYEVEQTPEEKLLNYFSCLKSKINSNEGNEKSLATMKGEAVGVQLTLAILGIKIKGINI